MANDSHIIRPYAQAVFELACDDGRFKQWSGMLEMMAGIAANDDMAQLLQDPEVSRRLVLGIFTDLGEGVFDEEGRNFLALLVENRRCPVLPQIAQMFEQLRAEHENRLEAQIISARPLGDEQIDKLRTALKRSEGRDVELTTSVDESLIGGVIIKMGDRVIDGSALGRLRQLAREMN